MRVRYGFILLLTLPLAGCGGCGHSGDPRDAVADGQKADEHKSTVDLAVRLKAATTLPKRGELSPELLAALQDDSPHVRRAAVFTVRHSGADAKTISAALTPLLKDKEPFLRVVAAETLWEADQDPEALVTMKKVLRDGTDLRAATRAIQALGEVGPAAKDVAPELTALLKNPDPRLRVVIAEALTRIRYADVPALAEALAVSQMEDFQGGDEATARALARVFAALGKDAVAPLITMMKSGDAHQQKYAALAIAEVGQNGSDAVPALAALLRVRQYNTHQTALEVLAHLGPAAEPALLNILDLLDDEDPTTSHEAAVAVGSIGRPALQPLMIRLRSKKVKNDLATVALSHLGKEAVAALLALLKSDDSAIRLQAALALGGMEKPPIESLPVLVSLFKEWTENPEGEAFGVAIGAGSYLARRRDSTTVWRLVAALGRFPEKAEETIPLLTPLLKDRSRAVRTATAQALVNLGPAARPALPALREALGSGEKDFPTTWAMAKAIFAVRLDRKEDVPVLVELLNYSRPFHDLGMPAQVVEMLGHLGPDAADAVPALLGLEVALKGDFFTIPLPQALGRIGDAALPQVVKAVRSKKKQWRWQASSLPYFGKRGRDELLKLLTDEDDELRAIAASCLSNTDPSPETAAALLDTVNDLNAEVRSNAVGALYAAGVEARVAVPALTKRLLDPKPDVRQEAALSLGKYGAAARPALPALLEALNDDNESVRAWTLQAIQDIGVGKEQVAALIAILKSKETGVRDALALLSDCGEEAKDSVPVLRELRKDERLDDAVLIALWHVARDGTSATRLLDRTKSPDREIRRQTATALGGKGSGAAIVVPALCDALRDPDALVRQAACDALGHMGLVGRAAITDLMALLQNEKPGKVYWAAKAALVEMRPAAREAIPTLKALLKKASPRDQVWLHETIWQINEDTEEIAALSALLADQNACKAAAQVLANIGARAKAAVPALRNQRTNRERSLAEIAAIDEALRKIEAK